MQRSGHSDCLSMQGESAPLSYCVPYPSEGRNHLFYSKKTFPCDSADKESTCNTGDLGSIPGLGRFPWRRERLPIPIFWPGDPLYSPWGHKESDTAELLSLTAKKSLALFGEGLAQATMSRLIILSRNLRFTDMKYKVDI